MRIVQCPACNQRARVPATDTAIGVECPGCRKVFEVPASAEAPLLANEPRPASLPPDSLPPSRASYPRPSPNERSHDDRDYDDRRPERRPRERHATFPVWRYVDLAANGMRVAILVGLILVVLDVLLVFGVAISARRFTPFIAGMIFGAILRGLFLIPVFMGANSLSERSSYGMAITGAIFALIAGLIFGLGIGGVFALFNLPLALGVFAVVVALASGAVGLMLLASGVLAIIALTNSKIRAEFGVAATPRPRCKQRDDSRRSRRDEDDLRHSP